MLDELLTSLSPMVGPMSPIRLVWQFEFQARGPSWNGIGIAILIKAAVAGILLWLTIKSFDRCLGRVPESRLWGAFERRSTLRGHHQRHHVFHQAP